MSGEDDFAILRGDLLVWPPKSQMARILTQAGLANEVGRYSIRLAGVDRFVFADYADSPPRATIEADADTPDALIAIANRVSAALAAADVAHRFEISYPARGAVVACLQHDWH